MWYSVYLETNKCPVIQSLASKGMPICLIIFLLLPVLCKFNKYATMLLIEKKIVACPIYFVKKNFPDNFWRIFCLLFRNFLPALLKNIAIVLCTDCWSRVLQADSFADNTVQPLHTFQKCEDLILHCSGLRIQTVFIVKCYTVGDIFSDNLLLILSG